MHLVCLNLACPKNERLPIQNFNARTSKDWGFMDVSTGQRDQLSALANAGFRNPSPIPKACYNPQKGVGDSENLDSFDHDEADTENCLRNSSKKDKNRVRMNR
jgi:hypothetical protein